MRTPDVFPRPSRLPVIVSVFLLVASLAGIAEDGTLAHFYGVNDPVSWASLRQNADAIELVSPDWFIVDPKLQVQASVDSSIVEWARTRHLRLMPLLSNEKFDGQIAHRLLADEKQQKTVIDAVVQACVASGFWGVQLDFENVPAEDRERFTAFVRRFAHAAHNHDLRFSVAVPAPLQPASSGPADSAPKWQPNEKAAGFDYKELGKAADLVSLMTYDEYVTQPGPIADLVWIEACTQNVLQTVSRKKLLLGISLYYRHWARLKQQGAAYSVTEGPYLEAFQMAMKWNARIEIDSRTQELKFDYDDGACTHTVWFADAATLRGRLELVKRYKLRGFSAWRLGQEDPAFWATAVSQSRR